MNPAKSGATPARRLPTGTTAFREQGRALSGVSKEEGNPDSSELILPAVAMSAILTILTKKEKPKKKGRHSIRSRERAAAASDTTAK